MFYATPDGRYGCLPKRFRRPSLVRRRSKQSANTTKTVSGQNKMATGRLTQSRIMLDFQPPVARLTLHYPPLNVIDLAMMDELAQALAEIEARADVSTLVLNGAGKSFSVGVDVAAHTPDKVADMLAKFHAVIRSLVSSKKITIASVHGHCLGGGAELAMVCDMVYTVDTAAWGFPEIKLGC